MPSRLKAIEILGESVKDLKNRGKAAAVAGELVIAVPLYRTRPDGELVRVNKLHRIWRPK